MNGCWEKMLSTPLKSVIFFPTTHQNYRSKAWWYDELEEERKRERRRTISVVGEDGVAELLQWGIGTVGGQTNVYRSRESWRQWRQWRFRRKGVNNYKFKGILHHNWGSHGVFWRLWTSLDHCTIVQHKKWDVFSGYKVIWKVRMGTGDRTTNSFLENDN